MAPYPPFCMVLTCPSPPTWFHVSMVVRTWFHVSMVVRTWFHVSMVVLSWFHVSVVILTWFHVSMLSSARGFTMMVSILHNQFSSATVVSGGSRIFE